MIVSGSRDCKVSLILTTEQEGYFKLSGHNGQITQARFFEGNKYVITSSLDNTLKIWNIESKSPVYTLASVNESIWDFELCNEDRNIIIGTASKELLVFDISKEAETQYFQLSKSFNVVREAKKRVMQIKSLSNGKIVIVQVILQILSTNVFSQL